MENSDYNRILSANIRFYLYKSEMTQTELAKKLNVSKQAVTSWIDGSCTPRIKNVDAMAKIFSCSRNDLISQLQEYKSDDQTLFKRMEEAARKLPLDVLEDFVIAMEYTTRYTDSSTHINPEAVLEK